MELTVVDFCLASRYITHVGTHGLHNEKVGCPR